MNEKQNRQITDLFNANRRLRVLNDIIIALIVLNIVAIILESFKELAAKYGYLFDAFEAVSVIVFTIEFVVRIWMADRLYPEEKHPRLRYLTSFMAIVDLMAILPFYLTFGSLDLRFLRITRLLSLFKLGRYFDALATLVDVLKRSMMQLAIFMFLAFCIVLFSAIIMYTAENSAQPEKFPNIVASLWWAVCTLTTVGYGDVYPITGIGKFLASVLSLLGIGIIAIPTGVITAGIMEVTDRQKMTEPEVDSEDERLLAYYHGADDMAKEIALETLQKYQKKRNRR